MLTKQDIEFYNIMWVSNPKLTPHERQQRRLSWRNERFLYHRKCDLTWKKIISVFSQDKPYLVYDYKEWHSDKWDPLVYWMDFDFSKNFFKQFHELNLKIPKLSLHIHDNMENCHYCNYWWDSKDCYLSYWSTHSEKCFYSHSSWYMTNDFDWIANINSENIYESIIMNKSYSCFYSAYCLNCTNCYFITDCISCTNCFWCCNLINKQYYFFNKKLSKSDYENQISEILNNWLLKEYQKIYEDFSLTQPKQQFKSFNIENCTWNMIQFCKDCENCSVIIDTTNSKYCYIWGINSSYCYDCDNYGVGSNYIYESIWIHSSYKSSFCIYVIALKNCFYCINCENCEDCFWCEWLKNKKYCILNKQYTKYEYELLLKKIIIHMKKTKEWWEFFPINLSPFWYNETVANNYYPLIKEEAIKKWLSWKENDNSKKYIWEYYSLKPIKYYNENIVWKEIANKNINELLNGILKCEITWEPYKIIYSEIKFYVKNNLQIPKKHPNQRYQERLNKMHISQYVFDNKCRKCNKKIKTFYNNSMKEVIYCTECYQELLIC